MWIEKQRNFIDFTLSSLGRRKARNASLLLVYTLIIFLIASVIFFSTSLRREAAAVLSEAPEMIVQRMTAGRHDLVPVSYIPKIGEIRGVSEVRGRLWGYYYHPAAGANYTVMVPDGYDHPEGTVKIGHGVSRTWGAPTSESTLYFRTFDGKVLTPRIAAVFSHESELVSADLILMSEADFRRLFGIPPGLVTDLAIDIANPAEAQVIAGKIDGILPDTRSVQRGEILRTYTAILDWRSGYSLVLLTGAVLAFFIFAWDKATGLSAEEKAEIGILKAVGWDTADILAMKFWEGCVISLTAFLTGIILAYFHVFFASAPLFEHALKGWGVLYPAFTLHPRLDAYQVGVLFCLTVLPYSLITSIPVWRASITDPSSAMRSA